MHTHAYTYNACKLTLAHLPPHLPPTPLPPHTRTPTPSVCAWLACTHTYVPPPHTQHAPLPTCLINAQQRVVAQEVAASRLLAAVPIPAPVVVVSAVTVHPCAASLRLRLKVLPQPGGQVGGWEGKWHVSPWAHT